MSATKKTIVSLALMAVAGALAGCSYDYHQERDPHMDLSTPSMIQTNSPSPVLHRTRDQNMMLSTSPQPMLIDAQPSVVVAPGADAQMLGQPGGGPPILSPTTEVMPGMRVEQSYPHASR